MHIVKNQNGSETKSQKGSGRNGHQQTYRISETTYLSFSFSLGIQFGLRPLAIDLALISSRHEYDTLSLFVGTVQLLLSIGQERDTVPHVSGGQPWQSVTRPV
jgi:hypothetical protein